MDSKIKIKISKECYKEKPTVDEVKKITWQMKQGNRAVTYKELAKLIEVGHSVLLGDFEELGNINEDNINSISCIALDIDSKENRIEIQEMISLISIKLGVYPIIYYCTFSDLDNSRFRLIYRFIDKIDVETYRALYIVFQWKFQKYLDPATRNANRIWAGTNKKVNYIENDIPITFEKMAKLIRSHTNSLRRKKNKEKVIIKRREYKEYSGGQDRYIKPEYKETVMRLLIDNIDLREFIPKFFGGTFKRTGGNLTGKCVIHGGDNETALVISKDRYTCFTHCGCGNIITAARIAYKINNFSDVALRLLENHRINIPPEYVREVKTNG